MIKFYPIDSVIFQDPYLVSVLPAQAKAVLANFIKDLCAFYEKRPDCGAAEQAFAALRAGEQKGGAFIELAGDKNGGEIWAGSILYAPETGGTLRIMAYMGRLSVYTDCAEAFERFARATGARAIETTTKPAYALQNGKLGYTLESYNWRKELGDELHS